ncbi:MAG: hypothetical protein GY836_18195, partial [Herbaspirillum sp.]|uniref:hypothetical protein n=1 Tax=Herbaspirillum sp. TaxID=1890675 RepID=UPI00258F8827
ISKNDEGALVYSQYYYAAGTNDIAFIASSIDQGETQGLTDVASAEARLLVASDDMSVSVYDIAEARVDYSISKNDEGTLVYAQYYYAYGTNNIAFIVSSTVKAETEGFSSLASAKASLYAAGNEASISVYDQVENRVDYSMSMNDEGDLVYSQYYYVSGSNDIAFIISSKTQSETVGFADLSEATASLTTIGNDASISVYDQVNNRVDYSISKNDDGNLVYSQYYYVADSNDIAFIVSSTDRTETLNLTDVGSAEARLLTASDDMSVSVYDTVNNRVDYSISRNGEGELVYSQYYYVVDTNDIEFIVSSVNQNETQNLANLDAAIASLMDVDNKASISVYDTVNNRVDYSMSKNDDGDIVYSQYYYVSGTDKIEFIVSSTVRGETQGFASLAVAKASLLVVDNEASISVYDQRNNRVDYSISRNDEGELVYSQYYYVVDTNTIEFIVTSTNQYETIGFVDSWGNTNLDGALQCILNAGNKSSVSVYDTDNDRVEYSVSKNDEGELVYSQYYYVIDTNDIAFIVSSTDQAETVGLTDVASAEARLLVASDDMSVSVYDTVNNRVDYSISKNDSGELVYSQYYYVAGTNNIEFIVTSTDRNETIGLTDVASAEARLFTASDDMSISVYDTDNNRVDYSISRNDDNELVYSQYYYADGTSEIIFIVSSTDRTETLGLTDVASAEARLLVASDDMSVSVYDTSNNRVDYSISKNDSGELVYSQYYYAYGTSTIEFIVSSTNRIETLGFVNYQGVTNLSGALASLANIGNDASLSVYDQTENRVDYSVTSNDSNELVYSQYYYVTDSNDIAFIVSSTDQAETQDHASVAAATAFLATASSDMSVSVYDIAEGRVDYSMSKNDEGAIVYSQYYYVADTNTIEFIISSINQNETQNLANLDAAIASLMNVDNEASISVYDTVNNRVDYSISKNDEGALVYSQYYYAAGTNDIA